MAENSKIEWTHHTANLWWGCTKVHEGCDHCYAETMSKRYGHSVWGDQNERRLIKSTFKDIMKYQKIAEEQNTKLRVFVGSMMDIFEKSKDVQVTTDFKSTGEKRNYFFNEIVPNCPNLIFLLLTKRPSNINKMIPEAWKTNPPKNVMFGTSPVNTKTAKTLIKQLQQVNGYRFLSVEPQLEEITDIDLTWIDWVIQGGESGHSKRPFNPDWGRTLRDICKEQNVSYFFKQIDKVQAIPEDLLVREFPDFHYMDVKIHYKEMVEKEPIEDIYHFCDTFAGLYDGDKLTKKYQKYVGYDFEKFLKSEKAIKLGKKIYIKHFLPYRRELMMGTAA